MLKQYPTARFILMRAGWYFITFLVAVTINFYLPRLGPSNPVDVIMAQAGSGQSREEVRQKEERYLQEFGLVKMKEGQIVRDAEGSPVRASNFEQFITYIGMCLKGDLGSSFHKHPMRVLDVIKEAVPWTIVLQLPVILFGWIVGNLLGALAAYRRGVFDKVFFPVALGLSAFPFFVFGMLLMAIFALTLGWFPPMGGYDNAMPGFNWTFIASAAHHYVLPFFSIFLILAGGQAIGMRSMGIYELGTDYIKYAKWLGLRETTVLLYLFRNAMLPQITGLALSLGTMIGGALITEMIFSYPGLGMAMLDAIRNNDYPMIQGVTLIITVSVLIANFTVDILIAFLDPRVKAGVQMGKGV
ncbi:MAG: ABC transporter permease [Chitinispirillia bacterium]|nr:ABC transporter permease [Chitinispirillia bacterium]